MTHILKLAITSLMIFLISSCSLFERKDKGDKNSDDCVSDYSKISVTRFSGIEGKNEDGLSVHAGKKVVTEYVRLQDKYILQLKSLEALCKLHREGEISGEQFYLALIENESQVIKIREIVRNLDETARKQKIIGFPSGIYTNNLIFSLKETEEKLILDIENMSDKVNTESLSDEISAIKNLANSETQSEKETIKVYALAADLEFAISQLLSRINSSDRKLKKSEEETKSDIETLSEWLDTNFSTSSERATQADKERAALRVFACDIARSFNDPKLWELCK